MCVCVRVCACVRVCVCVCVCVCVGVNVANSCFFNVQMSHAGPLRATNCELTHGRTRLKSWCFLKDVSRSRSCPPLHHTSSRLSSFATRPHPLNRAGPCYGGKYGCQGTPCRHPAQPGYAIRCHEQTSHEPVAPGMPSDDTNKPLTNPPQNTTPNPLSRKI
jgi:hypothetical protein